MYEVVVWYIREFNFHAKFNFLEGRCSIFRKLTNASGLYQRICNYYELMCEF